nr:hypothetical protein [Tanacetum cinerariifolium]
LLVDCVELNEYMAVWFRDQAEDLEQVGILNLFLIVFGSMFSSLGDWAQVPVLGLVEGGKNWTLKDLVKYKVWSLGSGHGIEKELEDMSGAFKFSERWRECERVIVVLAEPSLTLALKQ